MVLVSFSTRSKSPCGPRWKPDLPEELMEHLADRIQHRVKPGAVLGLACRCQVSPDAIVLVPPFHDILQVHLLPFRMPIFREPADILRKHLSKTTDIVTLLGAEVE